MGCTINALGGQCGERVDYWREAVRERFGVVAQFNPLGDGEFEQSMALDEFGPVTVGERQGSPFRVSQYGDDNDLVVASMTMAGSCDFQVDRGNPISLAPGSLKVFPLREALSAHYPDRTHHLFLALPGASLSQSCPEWRTLADRPLDHGSAPVRMLFDLAQSLLQNSEGLGATCRIAGGNMLVSLLASSLAAREEGEGSQSTRMQGFHLQRIRNYALTHLCDPNLDAVAIAAGVSLSLRYVHLLFAGEPLHLMQWVLEQRLARCHEAILAAGTAAVSISQIAYRWGFNDAAHFSRAFRKRFGVSPREVAEQARRTPNSPAVHDKSSDAALSGKTIALQHHYS